MVHPATIHHDYSTGHRGVKWVKRPSHQHLFPWNACWQCKWICRTAINIFPRSTEFWMVRMSHCKSSLEIEFPSGSRSRKGDVPQIVTTILVRYDKFGRHGSGLSDLRRQQGFWSSCRTRPSNAKLANIELHIGSLPFATLPQHDPVL